jgi:polyisoprenoid-binding protein YceI
MKKVLFAAAMLVASIGIYSFVPAKTAVNYADTYTVDTAKSKVDWTGSANNRFHPGTVKLKSGSVTVDNNKITGASFVFDLTSITVTDAAGERLQNHLKSPDFFDVAKFGEASFTSTSVTYTSDNLANVAGNLNVKGVSVPVNFTVKVRGLKDGKLFAESYFTLDSAPISKQPLGIELAAHLFANK